MFRLCLELGYPHPDYLLDDLTYRQVDDWTNYYQLEPFGEDRSDMRMARIVWAILQVNSKKELDENDYRFQFGPKVEQTWQERRAKAMQITAMLGGKIQ